LISHIKEEHRLGKFENRVLRIIFGPMGGRVSEGWRRLHIEGLHNLYNSPNVIRVSKSRRMREAGYVARLKELRNV